MRRVAREGLEDKYATSYGIWSYKTLKIKNHVIAAGSGVNLLIDVIYEQPYSQNIHKITINLG
jgi:hypothetical protein